MSEDHQTSSELKMAKSSAGKYNIERDDLYFSNFMRYIGDLHAENNPIFNDIVVVCGAGQSKVLFRTSSILMASISPVFKVILKYN